VTDSIYEYFELKNGVRACLVPVTGLSSVTVQVFVKIGSKYEEERLWGISHFLEHMAFKGTKKRKTAVDISKEFDRRGSSHNASTSHELTEYYVKTSPDHIEWGVEILADMLLNPTFPEKEVKKELGVVVEEINMYEDTPMRGIGGEFYKLMYRPSKVGCWNVLGSKESVLGISRDDLVNFREQYLSSKQMVVVIAGNLGEEKGEIRGWIEKYFSGFGKGRDVLPKVKMELREKKEWKRKKKLDQAHFVLGLPSITRTDERRYAMKLLDIILAGNTSSRLYQRIREKMGAAYYVFSISDSLEEAGFTGVQAGVTKSKLRKVIGAAKNEYLRVGKSLKEDDLLMAKDYLGGKLALAMDRSDFWADFVGSRLLLEGELTKVSEELERYKRVKMSDLKKLAEEFFLEDTFRLVVID
jgi:predicted Zn-dependent peptidase